MAHRCAYLGECVAFALSGRLQFLLTSRLNLLLIDSDAIERVLNFAFTLLFQAIDAYDDLLIQILIEFDEFFIYTHQFLLSGFFVNMCDDIKGKVENALQITWREIQ